MRIAKLKSYDLRVLIYRTKTGEIRHRREKKISKVNYFELLHILEFKKAVWIKSCADIHEYKCGLETGEVNLYKVWFCKLRLCPMCNWRRTMKHGELRAI
jgi:plasmid rolling circle replication initiator protein Rep